MNNTNICLRKVVEADLPDHVRWYNDPEVMEFFGKPFGNIILEERRKWFERVTAPDYPGRYWEIEANCRHLGGCSLKNIDNYRKSAMFSIIIGDKREWNKAYGSAATREVLRIAFEELCLERIYVHVFPEHIRAVHCYEKCGFRHEGLERRVGLRNGGWHDMSRMSILREEWQALQTTSEGLHLREFTWADYEQVLAIWQTVFSHRHPQDVPEELCKKLRRDPDLFLLACDGARVVGTVIGGWDGRRGYIYRMAVHPDYQRRGIGRMLLQELEQRFRSKGAIRIVLNRAHDSGVQKFYQSLGFADWPDTAMMGKDI